MLNIMPKGANPINKLGIMLCQVYPDLQKFDECPAAFNEPLDHFCRPFVYRTVHFKVGSIAWSVLSLRYFQDT